MPTRLIELVERLPRRRIVLVGDLMLDRYLYGNAERLSPEAPVPVLHFQREEIRLGGAGRRRGGPGGARAPTCASSAIVGDDDTGRHDPRAACASAASTPPASSTRPDRPTICKVRLVGLAQHRHPQQMIRLDYEDPIADRRRRSAAIA